MPFKNIPYARLATKPIEVKKCTRVDNAYSLFMDYMGQGKMKTGYFKDKTPRTIRVVVPGHYKLSGRKRHGKYSRLFLCPFYKEEISKSMGEVCFKTE